MRVLKKQDLEDFLFLDIETAPLVPELIKDSALWDAWEYYCIGHEIEDIEGSYKEKASLHAEFSRIACITIGVIRNGKIGLKTFSQDNEKELLEDFNETISKFVNNKTWLCGHSVIGFDAPFIMKRCLANRVDLHSLFDVAHLKPWETPYFDTAVLWKGTSFKMSSLVSLTTCLGLPSPKDDISGRDVGRVFWEGGIDRIVKYCEKDVVSVINVVMALRGEDSLEVAEMTKKEPLGAIIHLFQGGEYTEEIKSQLKDKISKMNNTDKDRAKDILSALPTKAKGKETFITKKDITELFE